MIFCRSEGKPEQLAFDSRVLQGYTGILHADDITVDDITYDTLVQL